MSNKNLFPSLSVSPTSRHYKKSASAPNSSESISLQDTSKLALFLAQLPDVYNRLEPQKSTGVTEGWAGRSGRPAIASGPDMKMSLLDFAAEVSVGVKCAV